MARITRPTKAELTHRREQRKLAQRLRGELDTLVSALGKVDTRAFATKALDKTTARLQSLVLQIKSGPRWS